MDRPTTITYPDGDSVNLTYNAQTLLESVEGVVDNLDYNARNQITTKELSNGVVTSYTYDAEKLLLDRIYTESLQDLNYDFDNVGNILEIEDNVMDSVKTYGYDDLDRLTSAGMSVNSVSTYQRDFSYDQYGCIQQVDENNVTISSYGYASVPFHAPDTYNGNDLVYDSNGNLVEDEDFTYSYNDANQLSEVRYSDNSSLVEKYWYDANGQRVKKQNADGEFSYYVNQFYGIENGTATSYFFRDDERIAKETSGDMEWYLSDHLGSTTLLVNESGLEVERTEYYPYGKVQSGGLEKYGFTGQENDADTGLMYYGARYYSPEYRIFVQPDTMLPDVYNPQALNRYAYCLNNPVKYTDPSGHTPAIIPLAVGVGMAAITAYSIISFAQDTIAWNKYEMSTEKWIANSALNVPIGVGGIGRTLYKGGKYLKTVNQASKGKGLLKVGSACGKSLFATGEATAEFIATEGVLFTGSQIVSHLDTSVDSTIQENTASGTRVGNALNWGGNTVAEAYDYTSNTASSVYDYTDNAASETYNYASSTASNVYGYASNTASDVYDYASNTASNVYDYASNKASTVTNSMKRVFSK
ncbi:RHS repeat-associated core domain-containing protein [uncultured Methanolobus sp.]|uniref:RHS repeat-associated core domain-containing protein n=1 Tax=uncultured Methanolobus sp. TaxID=218300 RepID=UPI002AABBE05|nr:RHS repeat-associated core domain-containing protein [uncultured Methanolobus sp.]